MNAPAKIETASSVDPLEIFRERCEAWAILVRRELANLIESVDELQADAECDGLVDVHGQDAVQAIMAAAFGGSA
jgi:hypothetical protein